MLEIVKYPSEQLAQKLERLLRRGSAISSDIIEKAVRDILQQVKAQGDKALCELTQRFDGVEVCPGQLRVPASVLAEAEAALDPSLRASIAAAAANIRAFHEREYHPFTSWDMEVGDGATLGKRVMPIERVGLCIPAGAAPLFSSLLMTAIPAQVAGVKELCVVSPPVAAGKVHPTIAATAWLLGIEEVYAIGGAQAVGALAYGTKSIPRVDKIVGPGSPYTVAAQRAVFGTVGISLLPGPSEVVILADKKADAHLVAADMLSQAEHGWEGEVVCITNCPDLAKKVQEIIAGQVGDSDVDTSGNISPEEADRRFAAAMKTLPRRAIVARVLNTCGLLVVVEDLDTGVELLNRIAPEHAELLVDEPRRWVDKIRHCGALFLGAPSTVAVGDYFAGTNHVLPTNGTARYASSLGVADFVKTTSVIHYTRERLEGAAEHIARMAQAEGLEAHAQAVRIRQQGPTS